MIEGGDDSRPVDSYFEAMTGITTTGATTMLDIESHARSILFWRGLTQWLGGMGIIVLALAILPRLAGGGRALMENEAPGPGFDKLAPRIRETATRLWLLYVGITAIERRVAVRGRLRRALARHGPLHAVTHCLYDHVHGRVLAGRAFPRDFGAVGAVDRGRVHGLAGINFALW